MPDNDAEPVRDGASERAALVGAVGAGRDTDETVEARVGGPYHGEELLDLFGVPDQLRSRVDVVAAQVEANHMALPDVLGPTSSTGGEEHGAVGHVADRLAVVAAGSPSYVTSISRPDRGVGNGSPRTRRMSTLSAAMSLAWR